MYRVSPYIRRFALALLLGALTASIWVNLAPGSYYDFIERHLAVIAAPDWIWAGSITFTPFMVVTDILMALFFFLIGKELWEALILERGALSGKRLLLPTGMTLGGMLGAAMTWLILSALLQTAEEAVPGGGWTVPLGTDTMIVYLFGRWIFGQGHPALHMTLLLAISTDIVALLILGLSNPNLSIRLLWLALPLLASVLVWKLWGQALPPDATERQRRHARALAPYLVAGALSWFGVAASGMPGALGLLPLVPAIAHADRSFGIFAEAEGLLHDPLNRLAQALMLPLVAVLFLFGLVRGGVDLSAFAPTTLITLGALVLGRPAGILLAASALLAMGGRLPGRVRRRHLPLIALLLGIGFSVPAIAIQAALPGGAMQEAARMGIALSLLAGPVALLLSRLSRR